MTVARPGTTLIRWERRAIMMLLAGTAQFFTGLSAVLGNVPYAFDFSAVTNFLFIPYHPFWTLTVIALDVLIIWALTAHPQDATI